MDTLSPRNNLAAFTCPQSSHSLSLTHFSPPLPFHPPTGFLVLNLYTSKTDLDVIVRSLSLFLGVVVSADVLRLNIPSFERLYERVLGFLMREAEKVSAGGKAAIAERMARGLKIEF